MVDRFRPNWFVHAPALSGFLFKMFSAALPLFHLPKLLLPEISDALYTLLLALLPFGEFVAFQFL